MSISNIKYRLSRRTKKLQIFDDQRLILALPKDVPERTWAEILQKEDADLFLFDIREEIIEEAMRIGYEQYMERQTTFFTSHCAAKAWAKLIDWQFYRHDPGEEPSAYPPAYIPKRTESWIADEAPPPSPKDTWATQNLVVVEETCEEGLKRWLSNDSIDLPDVEEIAEEYWFPGKVYFPGGSVAEEISVPQEESSEIMAAESEVIQNVTDYTTEAISLMSSRSSVLKTNTPLEASLQGAGDSVVIDKKKLSNKSKMFRSAFSMRLKDKNYASHLSNDSFYSAISDCRLRHLRLETQYEISPENIEPTQTDISKLKK